MELIPAIDIINGKCVRLTQGDFSKSKSYGDPLDIALSFEDHGLKRLHLVDLDGALEKRVVSYRILEKIATRTSLVIDAGGGVRSNEDLRILFESGASMVTGGSIAVKEEKLFREWLDTYGPEKIILGADFRDGKIAISGWEEETGLELQAYVKGWREVGIEKMICTDVARDGMLEGPAMETYKELKAGDPGIFLVASGGVRSMQDLEDLEEANLDGAIFGKAIYEGRIKLKDLENYIRRS